jgi:sugar/nucleoside kinase (ribokinase family)
VVDTNGAGDMYSGAFLYGITNGMGFEEAGSLASVTSATVVTQYGPRLDPKAHKQLLSLS